MPGRVCTHRVGRVQCGGIEWRQKSNGVRWWCEETRGRRVMLNQVFITLCFDSPFELISFISISLSLSLSFFSFLSSFIELQTIRINNILTLKKIIRVNFFMKILINLVLRHFCPGQMIDMEACQETWRRTWRCLIEFGRREANRNKCPGVGHLLRNNQDVCSLPSRSLAATMAVQRREGWPFKGYKCMPNGIRNRNHSTVRNGIVCGTLLPVARMPRMRATRSRRGRWMGNEW